MDPHVSVELIALGGEVRQCPRQFGEGAFGRGQRCFRLRDTLVDAAARLDARLDLFLELRVFGVEPLQRGVGIGRLLLFACDVGRELRQAAIELGGALLRALLFAVERFARIGQALQSRRGASFRVAQRRQFGGAFCLNAGRFRLLAGALRQFADIEVVGFGGFRDIGMGFQPAQVEQHGLGLAHLRCDVAIADCLPGLLFQAFHLAGELADHVLDAGEVGFGRLQPQLGFMPACMQTGDAGGIFQHAAALLRLGLNDLADLALVNQRRRACAGCGIGEQDLHVAGAHILAVDAINRAGLAFDTARNLQQFGIVDGRGRRPVRIVDRHHDFGVVARRTVAGAGKDHRIHVGRAQRLVRGLAHGPAQRFHEVGLAAAVRSDHAGEARLDHEIGGFDERLETVKTKTREFHGHSALLAGPRSTAANLSAGTIP